MLIQSQMLITSSSLLAFITYMLVTMLMLAVHTKLYTIITPHDEFKLIREGKISASVALGGCIIGFSVPLASVVSHSLSILDVIIWGVIASTVQLLVYYIASKIIPGLSKRIEDNSLAAGTFVAALSIAVGVLNAACMTPDAPPASHQVIEFHS